ncbi:hypothetical protein ACFC96_36450 [Streptomyces sp. NPDC055955]|uniref:hypothetical protein n=1 Tax=Streptomyces sp. NPDC055955 TaxID=3345665 RepID=UPI0035D5CCD9
MFTPVPLASADVETAPGIQAGVGPAWSDADTVSVVDRVLPAGIRTVPEAGASV